MIIEGYKVLNKNKENSYGVVFEEKKDYYVDTTVRSIKFGNNGYGYHFTKRLEDGLRYFNGLKEDIFIAKVKSLGQTLESSDEYYGYYDLYVTDHIYIDHILTRKEIIDYIINKPFMRIERLIQGYRLTKEEIDRIIEYNANPHINMAINYYQLGQEDAYVKVKRNLVNEKVIRY